MCSYSFVLFLVVAFAAVALADTLLLDLEFNRFKLLHNKVYETIEEEVSRKSVFKSNLDLIRSHNELFDRGEVTYTLGVNKYSDMETFEFPKGLLYDTAHENRNVNLTGDAPGKHHHNQDHHHLPKCLDWRHEGAVTPVEDQGICGSCWTFSATGAIEGRHKLKTGELISLSEQHLLDCSVVGNHGCLGGTMNNAYAHVKKFGGICSGNDYKYKKFKKLCKSFLYKKVATVSGHVQVADGDERDLLCAVQTGPVSVGIHATKHFEMYKSGVFCDLTCDAKKLNHGVLVVGYGTTENGKDYWLVKNSWGTSWGEDGYVRMSRNKNNQCGIASMASYPIV